MKSALIYFSLLLSFNSISQNFYDRSVVQNIELFFSFANWDAQLDAAATTESYIIADSVRINGVSFDSVGVKYKGNRQNNFEVVGSEIILLSSVIQPLETMYCAHV
jgi:spore coat protein CotH